MRARATRRFALTALTAFAAGTFASHAVSTMFSAIARVSRCRRALSDKLSQVCVPSPWTDAQEPFGLLGDTEGDGSGVDSCSHGDDLVNVEH